jgi:N-acetylglucosamine-6-phosphate deacetylase
VRSALVNGRVLTAEGLVSGTVVLISGSRIEALTNLEDSRCRDAVRVDLEGQLLLPGFIDVQVNGGGGVLFNDDPSLESIRAIGAAHRRFGTTGFMPTLISDDLDTIGQAIAAVQSALDSGVPGVLGIHIEGPFLNWARRGVHDEKHLRLLESGLVSLLCRLRSGRTLLTLAPEMTTTDMIAALAAAGVLISAGHSNATYTETTAAIAHGVRGFTHLFNAMARLEPRQPGIAGAALYDTGTWCGIIVDCRRRLQRCERDSCRNRARHGDCRAQRGFAAGPRYCRSGSHGQRISGGISRPGCRARANRAGVSRQPHAAER